MMQEDWKERRTKQIRTRVCLTAVAVVAVCAACAWRHVRSVSALEVSEVQQEKSSTLRYDFDTLLHKQDNFAGNVEDHETRATINKFCNNIEKWATDDQSLDVEYVHTLKVGEEETILDHSYCVTDNHTNVTQLSTVNGDFWYDLGENKCYAKPVAERNFYVFDSIDVFGRQSLLDASLYGSAINDVSSVLSFTLRRQNRVGTDVAGSVAIASNGLADEVPVNGVAKPESYSTYALITDDSLYVHVKYTYIDGDFGVEDVWYRVSQSSTNVGVPAEVSTGAVKTRTALESIVKGGE